MFDLVLFSLTRDQALFGHIILGLALIVLPALVLLFLKSDKSLARLFAGLAAVVSWVLLFPAGVLYLTFYPATKTLVTAGSWPWAHAVVMETKEHWGLLLPVIATVAAFLVFTDREEESKKWLYLTIALTVLLAVLGQVIKMGALQ